MKKIIQLFVLNTWICISQNPDITYDNIATNYSANIYKGSLAPGQQISNIILGNITDIESVTDIPSSDFPCINVFPNSNYFVKKNTLSTGVNSYEYYLLTWNYLFRYNGDNQSSCEANHHEAYSLPMTYSPVPNVPSYSCPSNNYNAFFSAFTTPLGTYSDVVARYWHSSGPGTSWFSSKVYYTLYPFRPIMQVTHSAYYNPYILWDYTDNLGNPKEVYANSINIYPNPSNDIVKIDITNSASYFSLKYQIMDLAGRKILEGTVQNGDEINIEKLNSGNYFIELIDKNNQNFIKKIIKN